MGFNLKSIIEKFQGKTTMFLIAFFGMGHVMAWLGKLDASYITFMTVLMGYVVGKSYKDDKHDQNMALINGQNSGGNGHNSSSPGPSITTSNTPDVSTAPPQ